MRHHVGRIGTLGGGSIAMGGAIVFMCRRSASIFDVDWRKRAAPTTPNIADVVADDEQTPAPGVGEGAHPSWSKTATTLTNG